MDYLHEQKISRCQELLGTGYNDTNGSLQSLGAFLKEHIRFKEVHHFGYGFRHLCTDVGLKREF